MSAGFTSPAFPLGISTPVSGAGFRSLLAFWMGGAAIAGGVPPTPQQPEFSSGGWPIGQRFRTDEEIKSERIRLGIIEQEKSQLEQEAAHVAQKRPKQGTEQDYQSRLYLALLNEQIAALEAQEALLLASLRELEYQAIEETDMVFVMAMVAEA